MSAASATNFKYVAVHRSAEQIVTYYTTAGIPQENIEHWATMLAYGTPEPIVKY